MPTVFNEDVIVNGTLSANTLTPSDGSVTNAKVSGTASSPIDADKLEHISRRVAKFYLAATATPSADVYEEVYTAKGPATIRSVRAKLRDCGTTTDIKFDLRKEAEGTTSHSSILSATIDFTHADPDNTAKTGTLSNTALVAGDTLLAFMDYTSATGAAGPTLYIEVDEAAN